MDKILEKLAKVLSGQLTDELKDFVADLSVLGLTIEESINDFNLSGNLNINSIYNIILGYAIVLIILVFLKKGFETYVLWTDGDADANPLLLLTNFVKALAIAICFPIMYEWIIVVVKEFIEKLKTFFGSGELNSFLSTALVPTGGLLHSLMILIGLIFVLVFLIKFVGTGLELLILRLGFPFACIGLLNSDGGVFRSYFSKLLQAVFGVIVQICIFILALELFFGHKNIIFGFATFLLAMRTPKFLSEFMITAGGGGGFSKAVGTTSQAVHMAKLIKK